MKDLSPAASPTAQGASATRTTGSSTATVTTAGLRLTVLTLPGHREPERLVKELSGSERTVSDYLFAEVLERQSVDARRLLAGKSILDRVTDELADLLMGRASRWRAILQRLEEQNASVVSVDAKRVRFRYHSLFADPAPP